MVATVAERLDRHQVGLYLGAILVGGCLGAAIPDASSTFESVLNPALVALLYVTFLQVPAASLVAAVRGGRFLMALIAVNFVAVPVVVAGLQLLVPAADAVRAGMLLVLLCPCIDYVVVFSGLAGADSRRLLAATPVLLVAQMVLLPVYLFAFAGSELAEVVDVGPFMRAFVVFIVVPLALAWATQWLAARRRAGAQFSSAATSSMVPLMMIVLGVVVASQVPLVAEHRSTIVAVVPVFVAFLITMPLVGWVIARFFSLDVPSQRAVAFSGATRNSLVVLPFALALPAAMALAPAVVVTQTLVEVVGMVIFVRVIPRLIPDRPGSHLIR